MESALLEINRRFSSEGDMSLTSTILVDDDVNNVKVAMKVGQ
jgi:hypothetical protein